MKRCIHSSKHPASPFLSVFCILIIVSLSACSSFIKSQPTSTSTTEGKPPTPAPQVEITFVAKLPQIPPPNTELQLDILDEVTGLSISPTPHKMSVLDNLRYFVKIQVPLNSIIKYHYTLNTNQTLSELTPEGILIRYRMILANGSQTIEDVVSAWQGEAYSGHTGRIIGKITNTVDNRPIPDAMVVVSGIRSLTSTDGSFSVENVPEGVHQLVAYSLDGQYQVFQQGAKVEGGLTTPAEIQMQPAKKVQVTFHVQPPKENVIGLPIRLAGNLYSLGNTFSDLPGDTSTRGSQMPLLTRQTDGGYLLTLSLGAGADLAYKYSLGNGFWNTELSKTGAPVLRHLIVPDHDVTIEDTIETWRTPGLAPVTLQVTAPSNTPPGESLSIQFYTTSWNEPLPMWPLGGNKWIYILYNPFSQASTIGYRYCRNTYCGAADQSTKTVTPGISSEFTPGGSPQQFSDTIVAWDGWQPSGEPTVIVSRDPTPRPADFSAGIEFQPGLDTSWIPFLPSSYQSIKDIGSNSVILTPTWEVVGAAPVQISLIPGKDSLWSDLVETINQARSKGLNVILFPTLRYPVESNSWWQSAPTDSAWWNTWFDQYERFIQYYVDLAAQTETRALVIGGEGLNPTLPRADAGETTSGVAIDTTGRWQSLIADIRSHYSGNLVWAIPYQKASDLENPPIFLHQVDQIYLLWSAPLSEGQSVTEPALESRFSSLMEQEVKPFVDREAKPIWIGLTYASNAHAVNGCPPGNNACLTQIFNNSGFASPADLQSQLDIYNAAFATFNSYSWIGGIFSRGYYPPVALQDTSASVHGKPASDVLWYWFPKILSLQP